MRRRVRCAVCGVPVDPAAAVGVGRARRYVHVGACFDAWLGARVGAIRAAVAGQWPALVKRGGTA